VQHKRVAVGVVTITSALALGGCGGLGRDPLPATVEAVVQAKSQGTPQHLRSLRRVSSSSTTAAATTTTTTVKHVFGNVDRENASAVAAGMLKANFTSNTTTDTSPFNAMERGLIWDTPPEAAAVRASAPTGSPGAEWTIWARHQVTTTVSVRLDQDSGAPQDTATTAYRQYAVQVTPHGRDGWTAAPDLYACFVTLVRTGGGPWQVSSLETDQ
jgi:hypothetical protein